MVDCFNKDVHVTKFGHVQECKHNFSSYFEKHLLSLIENKLMQSLMLWQKVTTSLANSTIYFHILKHIVNQTT